MTTPQAIIRAWCATCGMPEPSDGECHALEVGLAAGAQVAPAAQQGDGVEPTMEDAIAACDGTLHGSIDHWQRRALNAEQLLLARDLVLEEAAKACDSREQRSNREDVRATCRLCAKDIRALAVVNQSLTTGPAAPASPVAQRGARAEQALRRILDAIRQYLPPDGPSAHDTITKIVGLVDPWPLDDLKDRA